MNFRDWLFVEDHCEAIWKIVHSSQCIGETYNIGGSKDISNLNLIEHVLEILSSKTSDSLDYYKSLITFVEDRKGHDFRYAIDYSKIERLLGWKPKSTLSDGLTTTIDYYLKKYSN
ncbi:dTDP-glucose 4,6-dehydratase [Enterococcus sp. AZ163]